MTGQGKGSERARKGSERSTKGSERAVKGVKGQRKAVRGQCKGMHLVAVHLAVHRDEGALGTHVLIARPDLPCTAGWKSVRCA